MKKTNTTKEKIIETTLKLVNIKGINATSINDILQATGLKKGSLYFHFPSKDAIIFAVLDKVKKESQDFLESSLKGSSPKKAILNYFKNVLKKHKDKNFEGGCILGNSTLEMSDKNSKFTKYIERIFDNWIDKLKNIIERGQELNQITKKFPSESLARFVIASIEGGIMLSRLKKEEKPLKECLENLTKILTEKED